MADEQRYIVQVFVGALSPHYEALSIQASKATSAAEIVLCIAEKLQLPEPTAFELAEVVGDEQGRECKERRLAADERPVAVQLLWPRQQQQHRLYLRDKLSDALWTENLAMDPQILRDYFSRFMCQPRDREYPDLCHLPDLTEDTLLENLRARFASGHIYTYVNSILIALNPFKFYPIYNPKYVKLYQSRRLDELPPHIFAIADAAYQKMLRGGRNQCIVISGESGSGKTESTNFLLHHLTALSHKGAAACGVEQTILAAGPVLEAFGNSKTAHNNNSSRFGKFIQVNYKENGQVHGAVVQKYLLEKSRIVSQARNERNYHVFYYLLEGASDAERQHLHLLPPAQYRYLSQSECNSLEGVDAKYEFSRLRQSMEMVGFAPEKQSKLFALLSAVLLIGNVGFQNKKTTYHHDESVSVKTTALVDVIADLLKVRAEVLTAALTYKRARVAGEVVVINYRMQEAIAARDTLAKCVYAALFDWIVLQVNSWLLAKKDGSSREHHGPSIGVLDIFGFEDFGNINSFEQFCINYANEHLQFYFNQHVFKYEQEEYIREGIRWQNIAFADNTGCLQLFENKMRGLLSILDDQCNFPGATNETLLQKFHKENKNNEFYEVPQKFEHAFLINHYAGKVKYQVAEFREKNLDLMRPDIVSVLKSSSLQFVRELVGTDPVAVFRWAILRAFFRAHSGFMQAGARAAASAANGPGRRLSFRKPQPGGAPEPGSVGPAGAGGRRWSTVSECRAQLRTAALGMRRPRADSEGVAAGLAADELLLREAHDIVRKNKSFRPRGRTPPKSVKSLDSMRSAAGAGGGKGHGSRKQPSTVTAQFQQSLQSLLVTLNQANPFFIRCIKSNLQKDPNRFDDATVSRQLRYTGMLETVRIRQCGYNIRFTYEEFIQMYHILLPRGLLSSQQDVAEFLSALGLGEDNLQLGATKLFLRESVKLQLDHGLHQAILRRVVVIQRWFRTVSERRHFLRVRSAAVRIQAQVRGFLAQRLYQNLRVRHMAATLIQKMWRGYEVRLWYTNLRRSLVHFQARVRGNSTRRRFAHAREEYRRRKASGQSSESSLYIYHPDKSAPDEAFLSKESSQEELDDRTAAVYVSAPQRRHRDSEEPAPPPRRAEKRAPVRRSWSTQSEQPAPRPAPGAPLQNKAATVDNVAAESRLSPVETPVELVHHQPPPPVKTPDSDSAPGNAKTPFNRAKKHIKSIIVGTKKPPGLAPATPDTDDSDTEETLTLGSSSRSTTPSVSTLNSLASIPSISSGGGGEDARSREQRREDRRRIIAQRELLRTGGSAEPAGPPPLVDPRRDSVCSYPSPYRRLEKMDSASSGLSEEEQRRRSSIRSYNVEAPRSDEDALRARLAHQRSASADRDPKASTHHFQRATKVPKTEACLQCQKPFTSLFVQGYKCSFCKHYFHPKCVQAAASCLCDREPGLEASTRKKKSGGRWKMHGTSEFTDREDKVITDAAEVKQLEDFIFNKITELDKRSSSGGDPKRAASSADRVFQKALKQFRMTLLTTYGLSQRGDGALSLGIKYRDLIDTFASIMTSVIGDEQGKTEFPATMGVNAFRGYLDEFLLTMDDKPRAKKHKRNRRQAAKKKKDKREEEAIQMLGHSFQSMVINIPTACEICSSFMWLMEKGYVCQNCKLTCHKRCQVKVVISCTKVSAASPCAPPDRRLFGVPLPLLMADGRVPAVIEKLICTLELRGLYTEGLYRKSGVSRRVKHLRDELEEHLDQVDLEDTPVHVLAAAVKAFLRELPEPLLTFSLYDDFLRAVSIQDKQDQAQTVFAIIEQLPPANYQLLERLLFHLARVAHHEHDNRMSANALAIVFAPCILRTDRAVAAQDSLRDIAAQTQCVELMICERLSRLRTTLADIVTLEEACRRAQTRFRPAADGADGSPGSPGSGGGGEGVSGEAAALADYLQELRHEKRRLASALPRLAAGGALSASEDELLGPDSRVGSQDDLSAASAGSGGAASAASTPASTPAGTPASGVPPTPDWT